MTISMRTWMTFGIAVLVGIAAWEFVIPLGNRREAWDLPMYWQAAYPTMLSASAALGLVAPERPWRWALTCCLGQGVWALAKTTVLFGLPSLFPLGLVMFAILSLPCMAAAFAGAWIARRLA